MAVHVAVHVAVGVAWIVGVQVAMPLNAVRRGGIARLVVQLEQTLEQTDAHRHDAKGQGEKRHGSGEAVARVGDDAAQGDDDEQEEVVDVVKAVAQERNDGDDVSYYWCTNAKGLGERVRAAIKMTEVGEDPLVVLLDIPDRGGFYVSTESNFGKENVLKFLDAPGERKQM